MKLLQLIWQYPLNKKKRIRTNRQIYLLITTIFTAFLKYRYEKYDNDREFLDYLFSSPFSFFVNIQDSFVSSKLINLPSNHGYYIKKVLKLYLNNYFFLFRFTNLKIDVEAIIYVVVSILQNNGNTHRARYILNFVINLRCCSMILKNHLKFLECLRQLYSSAKNRKKYPNDICLGVTVWNKSYAKNFVDLTLNSLSLNNNLDYLIKIKKKVSITIVTDNQTKNYLSKLISEKHNLKSIRIIFFIFDTSHAQLIKGNLKLLYWSFLDQLNLIMSKHLNSHFFPLTADAIYSPNFIKNTYSQISINDFVLTGHALLKDSKKKDFYKIADLKISNIVFNTNISKSFHDEMNLSIVNYYDKKFIKYPSRIAWLSKNKLIIHYLYTHPAFINKNSLKYIKSCSRFDFKPLHEISKKRDFQFKFINNPERAFYATFTDDNQKFASLDTNFLPNKFLEIRRKDSPYSIHWKSFVNNKVILKFPHNLKISENYDNHIKLIRTTSNKDFRFDEM